MATSIFFLTMEGGWYSKKSKLKLGNFDFFRGNFDFFYQWTGPKSRRI